MKTVRFVSSRSQSFWLFLTQLYVTGHSLGGALATLFAFEAAAAPDSLIPKPVSLFSIAGPYVGDESFRSAHQLLESLGKLRHLRVSNHKDLVPTVPKISFRLNVFNQSSHVGAFFKHGEFQSRRSKAHGCVCSMKTFDLTLPFVILSTQLALT